MTGQWFKEKHVLEEARNIARNAPVFPGDTLSHSTAYECMRRGWATRDDNGDFIPTNDCPFQLVTGRVLMTGSLS